MSRRHSFLVLMAVLGLATACSGPEPEGRVGDAEASGVASAGVEATVPDVLATNAFFYYRDLEAAWAFYRDVLGFETVADFGFAKMLRVAPASYLTLTDEARGAHSADEPKSVTLAIVTEHVEGATPWSG